MTKIRRRKKSPIGEMTKETLGLAMGGTIGIATSDEHIPAPSLFPAIGSLIGAKAVIGMMGQMSKAIPRRKRKRI